MSLPKKVAIVIDEDGRVFLRQILHTTHGPTEGTYSVKPLQWTDNRLSAVRGALFLAGVTGISHHSAAELNRRNRSER